MAPPKPDWFKETKRFEGPVILKSIWQMIDTIVPYLLLWAAMIILIGRGYPYWTVLLLCIPGAGFLVRIFIIFHDCTHRSFFRSAMANRLAGHLCGILTFTPYEEWRRSHVIHHATAGNLDRRGIGDVWTMTVGEYTASSRGKRTAYRLYRNPFIMFTLGPLYSFIISQRIPAKGSSATVKLSVHITNLALAAILTVFGLTAGFGTFVMIQLPILIVGGAFGVWLFYLQHQFPEVRWSRSDEWALLASALTGSSFYKLPQPLRWFTGNIGFHHVHHMRPRIPNYRLRVCHNAVPELKAVRPVTFFGSLGASRLKLWDESRGRIVGYPPRRCSSDG